MDYSCNKCGSANLYTEAKGNNIGLYCNDCGAWIKWLNKNEVRVFEHSKDNKTNEVNKNESMNDKDGVYMELFVVKDNVRHNVKVINLRDISITLTNSLMKGIDKLLEM